MIRTSKTELKTAIAKQYICMLAESRNLSEEELQELGKWWRKRQQAKQGMAPAAPKPGRVDVGDGVEVLQPDVADFEQQLGGATWHSEDPEAFVPAAATQTDMRTIDIDPSERRPYAKKVGLAESQLRAVIADMVRKSLKAE